MKAITDFPQYRKFLNGKEFMKLNSNGSFILVKRSPYRDGKANFAIVHSDNPFMVADFFDISQSADSDRDEFEKAYGEAQFQLSKSNVEQ